MKVDKKWISRFFTIYLIKGKLYFFRKINDPYWVRHQMLTLKELKNMKYQRVEHFDYYRLPLDAHIMYW